MSLVVTGKQRLLAFPLRLLELAAEAGCRCWLGLGSQAEYGPYDGVLHENLPIRPVTVYGVARPALGLLSREICANADIRFIWLRLLATYGPKDDARHLIPAVILNLLSGQEPSLTRGEQQWDYLYVEDAVEAIIMAATNSEAQGVFNLGSGNIHTVKHIAKWVRNLINPNLGLDFGKIAYNPDDIMFLKADISKLQAATGWRPKTPLDDS